MLAECYEKIITEGIGNKTFYRFIPHQKDEHVESLVFDDLRYIVLWMTDGYYGTVPPGRICAINGIDYIAKFNQISCDFQLSGEYSHILDKLNIKYQQDPDADPDDNWILADNIPCYHILSEGNIIKCVETYEYDSSDLLEWYNNIRANFKDI